MRIIILITLFTSLTFAEDNSRLCNEVVKLATSSVIRNLDSISNFFEKKFKNHCSPRTSLEDQLVDSIIEEDKEKFNRILTKLENTYIFKLLKKLSKKEDLAKKFKKFLNDKFMTLTSRVTTNEKKVLREDPLKTLYTFFQYSEALDFIKENDPEVYKDINKPYGKADAIRHMFINATASRFGMNDFVKHLSTQRELSGGYIKYSEETWRHFNEKDYNNFYTHTFSDLKKCNPEIKENDLKAYVHEKMLDKMIINKMDIHNNALGIEIGTNSPCMSMASIYSLVKEKYEDGKALEIVSSAGRCFDVSSNYDEDVATKDKRDCYQYSSQGLKVSYPRTVNGITQCK